MKIILIIALCLITTYAYPLADSIMEELWLRQLADTLQGDIQNVDDACKVTQQYVYDKIKTKQGADPYERLSIYERIKSGVGWCNHQAEIFMQLISYMGISSRLVYLIADDGTSPHTIAEVFDGEKWLIVDVGNNIDFRKDGVMVSREDMRKDFTIITENERIKELARENSWWADKKNLNMYTNDAKLIRILKGDKWKLGERRRF